MSNIVDKKYFLQHTHFDKTMIFFVIKCRLIGGVVDVEKYILDKLVNCNVFSDAEMDVIKNNIDVVVKVYRIFTTEDFNKSCKF